MTEQSLPPYAESPWGKPLGADSTSAAYAGIRLPRPVAIATVLAFIASGAVGVPSIYPLNYFLYGLTSYAPPLHDILISVLALCGAIALALGAIRTLHGKDATILLVAVSVVIAADIYNIVVGISAGLVGATFIARLALSGLVLAFALSPQSLRWFNARRT